MKTTALPCARLRVPYVLTAAILTVLATAQPARTETEPPTQRLCTAEQLGTAVDKAGERLRGFNEEASPGLQKRLAQLATAKGWGSTASEQRAMDYLLDAKLAAFDRRAGDLLARIDTLSRTETTATVPCATIADLEAASLELLAVMKAKLAYTQDKITAEIGGGESMTARRDPFGPAASAIAPADPFMGAEAANEMPDTKPAETKAGTTKPSPRKSDDRTPTTGVGAAPSPRTEDHRAVNETRAEPKASASVEPPKAAAPRPPGPPAPTPPRLSAWNTTTERSPTAPRPDPSAIANLDSSTAAPPPTASDGPTPSRSGYTIDEIRTATQGFFGTISTNLASVIEYAFQNWGRPTAYILGEEGGGAFLAGLRYGKGTLYPRIGEAETIYWHGPSLGYDFGAAGSRTLILVYGSNDPGELYRSFTGLDGSAYLVGGVGLTLMTSGTVHIAPIRSGLGLRLGANIGYIRFAAQPTWNPF